VGARALLLRARQHETGFYLRLQASNESVGPSGLDVWLGQIRGGWKFN
jgi:hypothetical protein